MNFIICVLMFLIVITLALLDTYELFKKVEVKNKRQLVRVVKYTVIIDNKEEEQNINLKSKKKNKKIVNKK